ncbi:MAG: aminoacyl-tRNA hydrolase [Thermodesulfobacteriota bacterium]
MYLIAGLGNPGSKYEYTRHNAGFLFLDYLAETLKINFSSSKWKASTAFSTISDERVLLIKPESYMNISGQPLAAATSYYRIPPEKIIVVHDDLDLPFGTVKISVNRGAGGHKGVSSIIEQLGSKNFIRLRIGIGRPESIIPIEKYVLLKMTDEELQTLKRPFVLLAEAVETVLVSGAPAAMNKVNDTPGPGSS